MKQDNSSPMSTEAARAYVRQWAETGRLLEQIRWRELARLTPDPALAATDALIDAALLVPLRRSRRESSGLVELQALLHRRDRRQVTL